MPALKANLQPRAVTGTDSNSDDNDVSVPRLLGIIFVTIVILAILYFGARNARRRRAGQIYNTRRNQAPVRVQRLEGYSGNAAGGPRPMRYWPANQRRPGMGRESDDGMGMVPPPPVYDGRSDGVMKDPPPPYVRAEGGS
jgi:hypothetical protein